MIGKLKDFWYQLKCRVWRKYSTVKPRKLPHTWVDRSLLLPHMVFEILSQFLEKECGEDCPVAWDRTFMFNDTEKKVIDELWELYNWWWGDYLVNKRKAQAVWFKFRQEHATDKWVPVSADELVGDYGEDDLVEWLVEWDTPENEAMGERLLQLSLEEEKRYEQELNANLKRVIDVAPYMWT